ncbi:MAG: tetratricopeptide repeat protein [Pedobacter sp.]|nr:MAG: tetratricopeptide repeat protein [Pedobacter sp.]
MAEKTVIITEPTTENSVVTDARGFWEKYSRPIIYVGGIIIIAILGWMAYKNFIVKPKEAKANDAIFPAEGLFDKMAVTGFNKDSVNIALNGGNLGGTNITGLLKVMSTYSGTEAANRAAYMTGASYLHIKEFDKAIKYLKQFDGNGANQVQGKANLMIGHAYAEQKKTDDALSYYKKAASADSKDEAFASDALLVAASYAEFTGKTKEAIDLYKEVKAKYPSSNAVQNGDIDKYLAKLGVLD